MGDVVFHHVTSKKAGGDDVPENLMPLCVKHHDLIHVKAERWLCDHFPFARRWLEAHDRWDILDYIDQLELSDQKKLEIK